VKVAVVKMVLRMIAASHPSILSIFVLGSFMIMGLRMCKIACLSEDKMF